MSSAERSRADSSADDGDSGVQTLTLSLLTRRVAGILLEVTNTGVDGEPRPQRAFFRLSRKLRLRPKSARTCSGGLSRRSAPGSTPADLGARVVSDEQNIERRVSVSRAEGSCAAGANSAVRRINDLGTSRTVGRNSSQYSGDRASAPALRRHEFALDLQ